MLYSYVLIMLLFRCNPSSKRQNLERFYGTKFCLDRKQTEDFNKIKIGSGTLIFNSDMTFIVTNDSAKYSNIEGKWDICCAESDYGNYVFKVEGLKPWETNLPDFFVIVDSKKIRLFFTGCQ